MVVSYRLYHTIHYENKSTAATTDCLYGAFFHNPVQWTQRHFSERGIYERHRYCRGVTMNDEKKSMITTTMIAHGQGFSFDTLRAMRVTYEQLFEWYAPMDTVEAYIKQEKDGKFFNCTQNEDDRWFGSKCQYSLSVRFNFNIPGASSYSMRLETRNQVLSLTNGTCYVLSGGDCQSVLCLDWREICDGKIECANGLDELYCYEIEINQCNNDTEFRCQSGQCIDKVFFLDGYADCLDSSDEFRKQPVRPRKNPCDGLCEDRTCPLTWFSCGDGTCYDGPKMNTGESCVTKRDKLYFQRMSPSIFTLFSHVSLIYKGTKPEWICYNHKLCPHLSLNDYSESNRLNNTDVICTKFVKLMNHTFSSFDKMISEFKDFVRSCSLPSIYDLSTTCSMFSCENNSRCLSYYRLSDGNNDCPNGEDEQQTNSCSLGLPNRYPCDNGKRCIHVRLLGDEFAHCADKTDEFWLSPPLCISHELFQCNFERTLTSKDKTPFPLLCNGIQDYYSTIDIDTDESDCVNGDWPCLNKYTKCNRIWNCPNGQDELNCLHTWEHLIPCNLNNTHFCLNITTGIPFCLPYWKAGDNHVDCVGSTDERSFCRTKYPNDFIRRYRCLNSDICISLLQTCDCHQDCPENDDETLACHWINNGQGAFCDQGYIRCRDGSIMNCNGRHCRCNMFTVYCTDKEAQLFCELMDHTLYNHLISIDSSTRNSAKSNIMIHRSTEPAMKMAWKCNHGLLVHSTDTPSGFYCFCSQFYYGEHCQYQRKRVSLIIQPFMVGKSTLATTFIFVVLLVHGNTTILSHDKFVYIPQSQCLSKFKINLLFPITESSSSPNNYSIHLHVFLAETMEYCGSSYWTVPFIFLPVIRMAKQALFADTILSNSLLLSRTYGGDCTSCSNTSICIGYDVDLSRDVCICPLNQIGSRCLIVFKPCTNTTCNGHGQCIATSETANKNVNFYCNCDLGWYGPYCRIMSSSLNINVTQDIQISSFQTALIHIMAPNQALRHLTHLVRFQEQYRSFTMVTNVYLNNIDFIIVQILENLYKSEYYLITDVLNYSTSLSQDNLSVVVNISNRCMPLKKLLNETILAHSRLRRVKYFQHICRRRESTTNPYCFYDENLMCFCDTTNYADCFNFDTITSGCPWNKCSSRGKCIQYHHSCPTNTFCLCEPCSYGSICQFTTSGYSLSLDAILGSHIQTITPNISRHTTVIQSTVLIVSIVVVIGAVLNILGIGTFLEKTTRQVGCGLYLLISSLLGLLTMITLTCKIMLLIGVEQHNISCALVEFLLKWLPTCVEWLYAFVAIERALAVAQGARYSLQVGQRRTRLMIVAILVLIGAACSPELIYNRIIVDQEDKRTWCVFNLGSNHKVWQKLYSALDLLLFVGPLVVNLITSGIIIMGTVRSKEKTIRHHADEIVSVDTVVSSPNGPCQWASRLQTRLLLIKTQVIKHKHILIAPALLTAFSTSRLVMSLISVCKKLDRNPIVTLLAYLVGFVPSMSILFAFILPSESYRKACFVFIKPMVPKCIQNRLVYRYHRRRRHT